MEPELAFSMGKTFGQIKNIIEKIENMNSEDKNQLNTLFSNLLKDIKKSSSNNSIKEIEQKIKKFYIINNIEESKTMAKEIYILIDKFNETVYMKLKYNI